MWLGDGTCAEEASEPSVGLRVSRGECWPNCTKRVRRVGKGELGRKRTIWDSERAQPSGGAVVWEPEFVCDLDFDVIMIL